jgi:hypothetical protein
VEVIRRTTWEETANSALGTQLGLPPLSYIQLPGGRTWSKRTAVRQWVTANPLRPVIWADDDPLIRRCRKWLHRLQPHSLIVNPEKAVGITPADIEAIDQFLRGSASIKGQV